eukprot:PhM_4_TR7504/c0_g1_i1/m.94181/K09506/DNAJA5; DnaJ homolog subfamily A member 5
MSKRDYYEVLGIEPTATESEIKSAYRRLALKWHPDKNHQQQEAAENAFKEIVNAYGVLSNEEERAWYDNHKESVLRGEAPGDDMDVPEEESKLYPFFKEACFDGFGPGKKGFYAVYTKVFAEVILSTEPASWRSKYPTFGDANTPGDEVLDFYDVWADFKTKRDFAWCDKWKVHEASHRDERRAMQRENDAARQSAITAYVTTVRMLARHAMQRDPRVNAAHFERRQQREERLAAAEAKRKEELRKAAEEIHRMANDRTAEEIEAEERAALEAEKLWAQLHKEHHGGSSSDEESSEEEAEEFVCKLCSKEFKTQKQFDAHEKSAKHRAALKAAGVKVPLPSTVEADDTQQQGGGKKTAKQRQMAKKLAQQQREEEEAAAQLASLEVADEATEGPIQHEVVDGGDAAKPSEEEAPTAATPSEEPGDDGAEDGDAKKPRRRVAKEERRDHPFKCGQCGAAFKTRNALFTHLADTGHAVAPQAVPVPTASTGKGKKKK